MKKTLTIAILLASALSIGIAEAGHYKYPKQVKSQYWSIGAEYLDASIDRFEISGGSPSFVFGYGYRFNRYFEIGTDISIRTSGENTESFTDAFAIVDHTTGVPILSEPTSSTYQNSIKHSAFAGIHFKATYPVLDNFDVFVTAGGTYGRIEHDTYHNIDGGNFDHINNANTTAEYIDGIANGESDCYLTGVEASCGFPVKNDSDVFNSFSPSYGLGIRWLFYDSGSVHILNAGVRSLFSKDEFKVISYGLNYEYQY
jgi:opacity protein-like surface antigen